MKEYWVNVYEYPNLKGDYKYSHNCQHKVMAIYYGSKEWSEKYQNNRQTIYRFHVREFDTREEKELYLKMKYGMVISYRGNFSVPNTEGIFQ